MTLRPRDFVGAPPRRLRALEKVTLALRAWTWVGRAAIRLRFHPLPQVVAALSQPADLRRPRIPPARLGRILGRVLRVGPYRPRCILASLALYRLLCEQGDRPELVIGLPPSPAHKDAHAWVEVDGRVVGPPPGSAGHTEFARYG